MVDVESGATISIKRFRMSTRLGSIFFPIELPDLSPVLSQLEYAIDPGLTSRVRMAPSGIRWSVGGQIAQSKDLRRAFLMDPERAILSFEGDEIEPTMGDFSRFETALKELLAVDLSESAQFYEFILDAEVKVGNLRNPSLELERFWTKTAQLKTAGELVGWSATQFGVRLVKVGALTTDSAWADFKIEPNVTRPKTHYLVTVVYRDPNEAAVMNEAKQMLGKIGAILDLLGNSKLHE